MTEWRDLNETAYNVWETNAANWDEYMGAEGNSFHLELVRPGTEQLLDVQDGQRVLDIACGNGNFSRRLAELGALVTAFDFSKTMIERARARTTGQLAQKVTYRVIDATDYDALLSLGTGQFDATVANMALMDISDITALARAMPLLLKAGAPFVFSVSHPCFQTPGTRIVTETEDIEGKLVRRISVQVSRYVEPESHAGAAIPKEPVPSRYFHRPLSLLLAPFLKHGFMVDGMQEPVFDANGQRADLMTSPTWMTRVSPVIIVRMRNVKEP